MVSTEMEELDRIEDKNSDEYKDKVKTIADLSDRVIELERIEEESKNKERILEAENKGRWIDRAISLAGIVLPLGCTVWGTLKSLKFEKEGTVSTIIGRGFINKLLPKK